MQAPAGTCKLRGAPVGRLQLRLAPYKARLQHNRRPLTAKAAPKDVYVLDFDGCMLDEEANKLHKGINSALKQCPSPWYVTATPSASQAAPLLTELTGEEFTEDSPRLFAGLDPPHERTAEALR